MNRTYPQNFDATSFGSAKSLFTVKRGSIHDLQDSHKRCSPACIPCTRRCICVSAISLTILGTIAAVIALVVTLGIPPHTPGSCSWTITDALNHQETLPWLQSNGGNVQTHTISQYEYINHLCVTASNQTGFLCDDRESCIPASQVCDTRRNCVNGEDEQETLCSDLPSNLPEYLIFHCSNPKIWIYSDQRCNGFNNCGDCSDEIGTWASCPPCGPQWWSCTMVVFQSYCTCIPKRLCRDGIQHCFDWSDEYICTR